MTDKQIIIDDQKETIRRLQQECTEKTNAIIALGEQLKAKEQECEELKKENQNLKNMYNSMSDLCEIKDEAILDKNADIEELSQHCFEYSDRIHNFKQALDEIIEVIKKLNGESIITIPDFSKEENYKLIMKQCNEGYVEILNIINKAKGGE